LGLGVGGLGFEVWGLKFRDREGKSVTERVRVRVRETRVDRARFL